MEYQDLLEFIKWTHKRWTKTKDDDGNRVMIHEDGSMIHYSLARLYTVVVYNQELVTDDLDEAMAYLWFNYSRDLI